MTTRITVTREVADTWANDDSQIRAEEWSCTFSNQGSTTEIIEVFVGLMFQMGYHLDSIKDAMEDYWEDR